MADRGGSAWCLRLTVPGDVVSNFERALEALEGAVASGLPDAAGQVTLDAYLAAEPERARVVALLAAGALAAQIAPPDFEIERLPDLDWVAEGRKALPPILAGPFYLYGAHVTAPPPPETMPIRIEASVAFGTGRHETTRGCLLALADIEREGVSMACALDMGCGSGILALAAAKLWGCSVLAVDNDPEAVRLSAENARINGEAKLVRAEQGDGYATPAVAESAPYDLIVANILAGPLQAMAGDLIRHLAPGGTAVLSGLLSTQSQDVLEAHRPLGLVRDYPLGDWTTLVIQGRA